MRFFRFITFRNNSRKTKKRFNLDLIVTPPSVIYKIIRTDEIEESIHNPAEWPLQTKIKEIKEPWIKASIFLS